MGWQDRDYSKPPQRSFGASLWGLLNGSVSLGRWFDIEVRVHASLLILLGLNLLFAQSRGGMGWRNAVASSAILFGLVLLHEFGHCAAARRVGGHADHVLLWPLGGLAFVDHPQRPWPTFVTVAGGPAVNLVVCIVTGLALKVMSGFTLPLPISPFLLFYSADALQTVGGFEFLASNTLAFYLWWIYAVSLSLLLFNLLPIFPLDGGRIFQSILWPKMGFYQSMNLACLVGMVGGAILMLGLFAGNFWTFFLGLNGLMCCYQTRMNLSELSQRAWEDSQYSPGGYSLPRVSTAPRRSRARPRRKHDDDLSWRDMLRRANPLERIARARRKKQFERLFDDDK